MTEITLAALSYTQLRSNDSTIEAVNRLNIKQQTLQ